MSNTFAELSRVKGNSQRSSQPSSLSILWCYSQAQIISFPRSGRKTTTGLQDSPSITTISWLSSLYHVLSYSVFRNLTKNRIFSKCRGKWVKRCLLWYQKTWSLCLAFPKNFPCTLRTLCVWAWKLQLQEQGCLMQWGWSSSSSEVLRSIWDLPARYLAPVNGEHQQWKPSSKSGFIIQQLIMVKSPKP